MAQGNATVSFKNITGGVGIGVNNAPLSATFHLPPEPVETPPSPSSTVPFPDDPDFVDRSALRIEISTKLSAPGARVALVGLGGAGKTRLAVEYVRRIREESPGTWVLWLHAGTAARFEQSVRDIAEATKIHGRRDPKANIFQLFRNWLCDAKKGKWIAVLDNVDRADFLLAPPASTDEGQRRRLIDYLPVCEHGSVLITTRIKSEARRLVHISQTIEVLRMDNVHAKALLEKKLGFDEGQGYEKLAASLDYLPLAMAQAAAYICERRPRCSVEEYVKKLEKSGESRMNLLRRDKEFPDRKYDEASSSILLAWQISFDHIIKTRPSAADLLSVMSFCDRQAIPESLVRDYDISTEQSENVAALDDEFEEDVTMLRNFSFISNTTERSVWEMHRLVQDATRMWLGDRGKSDDFQDQFLLRLDQAFPPGIYENWTTCQLLFPHVQSAKEHRPLRGEAVASWASIMCNAAWYALLKGQLAAAEVMAAASMQARASRFGESDTRTMESTSILGNAVRELGRWKEAEQLFVKLLEMKQATLGPDNPNTLISMADLASTYWNQGRWKEAEQLEVKVLEIRQATLGPDHPDTLSSMANLASTYWGQERWKEAEQLEVKVIEIRQATLGPDHPSTLSSMANLASTYWSQGRWEEAEKLQVEAINGRIKRLGREHPDTVSAITNLEETRTRAGSITLKDKLDLRVGLRRSKVNKEAFAGNLPPADAEDQSGMQKSKKWWQRLKRLP